MAARSPSAAHLSPRLDDFPGCNSGNCRKPPAASVAPRPDSIGAMSTCVVTGGAGFLGSHLCEHLLGQGHRVICIDNLETGSLENIAHIRDEAFEFRNVDITEYVDIPEDVDFVYHLASPASPIDYLRLPLHTLKVGSHGTHHMLGVAKFKRARFLIASTSEVYGDPQVHPQKEDYWGHVNPIGPRGVYDEAKRYAEALTMAYHRQQGVDTAIVRIFNTYGPRMRPHDGRAIPTFLRQALQDRPLTVFGDGSQTRSFCYVDDLIRGIVALAESDVHTPVNIGNPNEFTLLELAKAVIEVTESRSEIVYEALPTDDPQQRQPDIGRARDLLGWEPTVELERGPAPDDRRDRRRAPRRRQRLSDRAQPRPTAFGSKEKVPSGSPGANFTCGSPFASSTGPRTSRFSIGTVTASSVARAFCTLDSVALVGSTFTVAPSRSSVADRAGRARAICPGGFAVLDGSVNFSLQAESPPCSGRPRCSSASSPFRPRWFRASPVSGRS